MTEQVLLDYEDKLRSFLSRAEHGMSLLPKYNWDITINIFGDITLKTEDTKDASKVLIDAGFDNFNDSDFYFKGGELITLKQT